VGLLAAGCTAFTDASDEPRPAAVRPVLRQSFFHDPWLVDGGIVRVYTGPEDAAFVLEPGQYLLAEIETSAGDRKAVRIVRQWCGVTEVIPRQCGFLTVRVRQGLTTQAVAAVLAGQGARLLETKGDVSAFYVPAKFNQVRAFAQFHPDVAEVSSLRAPTSGLTIVLPPWETWVNAIAPFSIGAPAPDDGTVQAVPDDTLVFRYLQPNGDTLTAMTVVPTR
jgi:hypothetical protein